MGDAPGNSKLLIEVGGQTILGRCLQAFEDTPQVDEIVLVSLPEHIDRFLELAEAIGATKLSQVVAGGETRSQSVRAGVASVSSDCTWVAVHDAARPLITPDIITSALECAAREGAALVAIPARDTLKESSDGKRAERTIDRERVWIAQTPQVFPRAELLELLVAASDDSSAPTDESILWEEQRGPVAIVEGAASNAKITTPEDVALAEAWLAVSNQETS